MKQVIISLLTGLLIPNLLIATETSLNNQVDFKDSIFDSESEALTSVKQIEFRGDGCDNYSASGQFSPDNRLLELSFQEMNADSGYQSRTRAQSDTKTCFIDVSVRVLEGYQVGFNTAEVSGYAHLSDQNARGQVYLDYSTDGRNYLQLIRATGNGPLNSNYRASTQLPDHQIQWSPCSYDRNAIQRYQFRSQIKTTAQTSNRAYLGAVNNRIGQNQNIGVVWRQCSGGPTPPNPRPGDYWYGSCRVSLETAWGRNVRYFDGSSVTRDRQSAVYAARDQALQQCQAQRNGDYRLMCTVLESQCYATRR